MQPNETWRARLFQTIKHNECLSEIVALKLKGNNWEIKHVKDRTETLHWWKHSPDPASGPALYRQPTEPSFELTDVGGNQSAPAVRQSRVYST